MEMVFVLDDIRTIYHYIEQIIKG